MKSQKKSNHSKKVIVTKIDILSSIENIPNKKLILYLAAIIIGMSLVLYNKFVFGSFYFLFNDIGYDTITLYWTGYYNATQIIREGLFSTWSFKMGIGSNMFVASHYFTDPFTLIYVIIGEENIAPAIVYVTILKHLLAGLFTYLFLSELKISKSASIITAILFAFNGYLTLWGQHYQFGSFVIFIPLLLYAFERLLKGKGYILFPLVTTLLALHLYLFYQLSIYLVLFFMFRIFSFNEWKIKDSFTKIFSVSGLFILGIALAAFVIAPKYYVYAQNPRIEDAALQIQDKIFSLETIKYYAQIIFRLFSNDLTGSGHDFFEAFTFLRKESINISYFNYYEYPQIYAGIISLIILPFAFYKMNRKDKTAFFILTVLLFTFLIFPIFSYILNAFKTIQYRWVFIIPLFLNFTAALALNNLFKEKKINRKIILIPAVVLGSLLLFALYLCSGEISLSILNSKILTANTIPVFILIGIYSICIIALRKNNFLILAIFIIVVFELIYINYPSMNDRTSLKSDVKEKKQVYYDGTIEAVNYLKSIDKGFYRLNKQHYHFLNDALIQDFYGVQSYSSLNHPSYINFLNSIAGRDYNKFSKTMIYLMYPKEGKIPYLSSFLGIKYFLTKAPKVHYKGFRKIKEIAGVNIFQNTMALPLGFAYEKVIRPDEDEKLDPFLRKRNLLKGVVLNEIFTSNYLGMNRFSPQKEYISLGDKNYVTFTNCFSPVNNFPSSVKFSSNHYSSISIPINTSLSSSAFDCWFHFKAHVERDTRIGIHYKYDGKVVKGLTSEIKHNNPIKNFDFTLPSNIESIILSFPGYSGSIEISDIKIFNNSFDTYTHDITKLKESSFVLTYFKEDRFSGSININKNKFLLFTIPFDKGWNLKVNGIETQLIEAQNGLLGVFLKPGNYKIDMAYTPPKLMLGITISIISLVFFVLFIYFKKKRQINI